MNSSLEAQLVAEGVIVPHTAAADLVAGAVEQVAGDLLARIIASDIDYSVNPEGQAYIRGIFDVKKASGTGVTFAVGDEVWWDRSANTAIRRTSRDHTVADEAEDFLLGICTKAAVTGDACVRVNLNARVMTLGDGLVPELDCQTTIDTGSHLLLPSALNKHGVVISDIYAIVSEQFGGDSEDQGVVTVYDEDDTALATLTPSDAGADAVGDIIAGSVRAVSASTGTAIKTVAAGKYIDCKVTTATSGTNTAGKMKVHLICHPLV